MAASHDAAASAVGYLYQAQWGLLEVLRAAPDRPDHLMSFERLDDIAWEDAATNPERLLQLKHHQAQGTVGDKSVDLWRTLRVWMDVTPTLQIDSAELYLLTTDTAAIGSALSLLRPDSRDTERALATLVDAASTSSSAETNLAREQFLGLTESQRRRLVESITILDGAPTAGDVFSEVRAELTLALPAGHEEVFLAALWGWWYSVILDMLQKRRNGIRPSQLKSKISDLRDDFSRGSLPTLVSNPDSTESAQIAAGHRDRVFVHQMRWVETPEGILARAIVDYYRAVTQAQLWLEDDLVGLHELEQFERNLVDEWRREMEWRISELPLSATEADKVQVGRQLLRDALGQTKIRIRERYDEIFFSRGKYHELADSGKIGWHPDFEIRLNELLARAS